MTSSGEVDKKRMWIKYYCEECKSWETRDLFEAKVGPDSQPSGTCAGLWSWGCSKLIRHGYFQTCSVDQLNNADGHDNQLKFSFLNMESLATQPVGKHNHSKSNDAAEVVNAPQSEKPLQSTHPQRNIQSSNLHKPTLEKVSPIDSQLGVTSSRDEHVLPDENGASTVHLKNRFKDGPEEASADMAGPESPAVIDAELHENGVHKRPRRLTAGDRGLAQSLQYKKAARITTKHCDEGNNRNLPQPSLASMKRPKRVTAGLRGFLLAAENAKPAPKKPSMEQRTDKLHRMRTGPAVEKSLKNKRLGDLY